MKIGEIARKVYVNLSLTMKGNNTNNNTNHKSFRMRHKLVTLF